VPASLALDLFDGVAYAGVVAFAIDQARPPGVPAALGLAFLETNARTYVHVDGRDPGVYFFSLDAASNLAVGGARVGFGLPYFPARMRLERRGRAVSYAVRRLLPNRPRFAAQYTVGAPLGPAAPGTLEHFLVERYLLHVERGGALWSTQVHHRPYPLYQAHVYAVSDELLRAAGLPAPAGPPLAHFATRVDVDVFAPRRRGRRASVPIP
jgi:uncharacterized protein YqjF (DUF2071 family)